MVNPVKNDVPGSPVVALSGGQVLSLSPISVMEDILPDGKVSFVPSCNDGFDRASSNIRRMWSAWLTAPCYSESTVFADDHNMIMCHGVLLERGLISPASNVGLIPTQKMIQLGALRIIAGFMRRHVIKWTLRPFLHLCKYGDTKSFMFAVSLLPRVIWLELDYDLLMELTKSGAIRIIGRATRPTIAQFRAPHVCWAFEMVGGPGGQDRPAYSSAAEAEGKQQMPCPGWPRCPGGPLRCPLQCLKYRPLNPLREYSVDGVKCMMTRCHDPGCNWPWRYPHRTEGEHRRLLAIKAKAKNSAPTALRRCTIARRRRDPRWQFVSGASYGSFIYSSVRNNSVVHGGESLLTLSNDDGNNFDVDGNDDGTHVGDDDDDQNDHDSQRDDDYVDTRDSDQYEVSDDHSYPDYDSSPHGYEEYSGCRYY